MSMLLTESEAVALLRMSKHHIDSSNYFFPSLGGSLRIPLFSDDRREEFSLDITRGRIALHKNTFQNRARKAVIIARLDIGGPPHRNPDGEEMPCPHMHIYKEGYGDKWAISLPAEFNHLSDSIDILEQFMKYCNVVTKPVIERELFT